MIREEVSAVVDVQIEITSDSLTSFSSFGHAQIENDIKRNYPIGEIDSTKGTNLERVSFVCNKVVGLRSTQPNPSQSSNYYAYVILITKFIIKLE